VSGLFYEDHSGYHPSTIYSEAALLALGALKGNITLPLPSLIKAYWLAKSYDYDVNIAFTKEDSDSGTTFPGTITGSGTIQCGRATGGLGVEIPPAQRTTQPPLAIASTRTLPFATLVTLFNGINSGTANFTPIWPTPYPVSSGAFVRNPTDFFGLTVDSSGNYRTSFETEFGEGFSGFVLITPTYDGSPADGGPTGSTATISITVDGVASPAAPLWINKPFSSISWSASGHVNLNFNNFY
jgi:hypothetical protein